MKFALPVLPLLIIGICSLLPIRECFWVDELHSVWAISGFWSEVSQRAMEGNQSPVYFFVLKAWYSVFGTIFSSNEFVEVVLRSFSWCGWIVLVGIVFYLLRMEWEWNAFESKTSITHDSKTSDSVPESLKAVLNHSRYPSQFIAILFLTIAIVVDRIGSFYAIELRPYAWESVVCLMMIASSAKMFSQNRPPRYVWVLLATTAFYLHYTAILVIVANLISMEIGILCRIPITNRRDVLRVLRDRMIDCIVVMILILPGISHLISISGRANQWATFAGDISLYHFLTIVPWFACGVMPLAIYFYQSGRKWFSIFDSILVLQSASTLVVTLILSWLVTQLSLAPLMHTRYVFGVYPLIWVVAAIAISRMQLISAVFTSMLCIGMLGWTQGTWNEWQEGRFIAWQRGEDWRGATGWLAENIVSDASVAIAPMWIETRGDTVPTDLDKAYLTCPISTVYPVAPAALFCVLPNESDGWKQILIDELHRTQKDPHRDGIWILVRVDRWRAERIVDNLEKWQEEYDSPGTSDPKWAFSHEFDGGKVQVIKAGPDKFH